MPYLEDGKLEASVVGGGKRDRFGTGSILNADLRQIDFSASTLFFLDTALDADSLDSLRAALAYCREKKLGMIEASDRVVPLTNQCMTDDTNLRVPFLGKMEP